MNELLELQAKATELQGKISTSKGEDKKKLTSELGEVLKLIEVLNTQSANANKGKVKVRKESEFLSLYGIELKAQYDEESEEFQDIEDTYIVNANNRIVRTDGKPHLTITLLVHLEKDGLLETVNLQIKPITLKNWGVVVKEGVNLSDAIADFTRGKTAFIPRSVKVFNGDEIPAEYSRNKCYELDLGENATDLDYRIFANSINFSS